MITFLRMFPSKNGISGDLIPKSIILGFPNQDYNKLNITLGAYSKIYKVTTNNTKQRTVGVIVLRP